VGQEHFSEAGDSGAFILDHEGSLVGLLFGGAFGDINTTSITSFMKVDGVCGY
jgi:hypothetical protein